MGPPWYGGTAGTATIASVTSVKYLAIHGGCRVPDPTLGASHSPQVRSGDLTLTDFSSASEEFKDQFELADLVFAKGMGNYETLSELPIYGKIVYCLMAKCQPIADSLQVALNSYAIMLR